MLRKIRSSPPKARNGGYPLLLAVDKAIHEFSETVPLRLLELYHLKHTKFVEFCRNKKGNQTNNHFKITIEIRHLLGYTIEIKWKEVIYEQCNQKRNRLRSPQCYRCR